MALLPGLIEFGVLRLRRQPQQRLTQRTVRLFVAVRQTAQHVNTLAPRRRLIGQDLAQRQLRIRILRMRGGELPQVIHRLRQQRAIARHRQIIFRRHAGRRLVAAKGIAPGLQRRRDIAAARLLACQRQLRLRDGLQLARAIQLGQMRIVRRRLT